jgi:biopolymer transport protein ExbD
MAISLGPSGDDEELLSTINTTPLVDVMLVLLIIFLITIPVVTHTVPVQLPKERNQANRTKPQNIVLAVTKDGDIYWNQERVADIPALFERMKKAAQLEPQPELHIRGDQAARYEYIGKVVMTAERAGLAKLSFITEPPPNGG